MSKSHRPFSVCSIFCIFLAVVLHPSIRTVTSQSSVALPPGPSGPTNISAILDKAGQFTTLIRLLKTSQLGDQINTQLNSSNQGLTVFAPTDNAFSSLSSGTLNSLTDQQKVSLLQFHVLPTFLSVTQFQTVSNPLRTQSGDSNSPLNITTSGNQVNISTGVDNTTISNTIYSDNQLAVYQVDKVLLPYSLFGPPSPAPAPVPATLPKKKKSSDAPSSDNASIDASGDVSVKQNTVSALLVAATVAVLCL